MDRTTEIERFVDPLTAGARDIAQLEDAALRTQALELWAQVPDVTTEERRFLPATVVQIADQFSDEEPATARMALSAASILLGTGEINSDGSLDDEDMDSIGNVAQAMTAMGLEGVDASFMAEYFGVNATYGGLLALNALYESILELTPEEVAGIRRELSLDGDSDFEDDLYSGDYYDEEAADIEQQTDDFEDELSVEHAAVKVEQTEEEASIVRLQEVLGHVGLIGVDVVTLAEHFAIPLDTTEALDELSVILSVTSDEDINELRFMTDASSKSRPQDIALALEKFRNAIAQIHDEEGFGEDTAGTTSVVTDDTGEEFEL